jgi:uncharacterized membrane protein
MKKIKAYLAKIFIDGLSGMALGLFSTLIIGTILAQIGQLIGDNTFGNLISSIASVAKSITGAGIGVGVAYKFKSSPLLAVSAAVSGMIGAFASSITTGAIVSGGGVVLSGPGEPLGAFIAAFAAIEIGSLVSGKTKADILITPAVSIAAGSAVALLVGPPISSFMTAIGSLINWGTERQPLVMGVVVAVLMGLALTLPISSAALGLILQLSGLAGGAAVAGCCAQMVGFAVASYRENKFGGLISQGIGTSMIQIPNIVKKPVIWIPATVASAVVGPISSKLLGMTCNPTGAGMGTSGLVGQIMTFQSMTADGFGAVVTILQILAVHFLIPAAVALAVSEIMRKFGWIKHGDMALTL